VNFFAFSSPTIVYGGERASTTQQHERGRICWKRRGSILPPHPGREPLRASGGGPVIRKVYARYWREGPVWRVALSDMAGESRMRDYTFANAEKIEELARRAGVLNDLAGNQALDTGIRSGAGGFQMGLSEAQFAKVTLGRK
jgi:hypothetical protein